MIGVGVPVNGCLNGCVWDVVTSKIT